MACLHRRRQRRRVRPGVTARPPGPALGHGTRRPVRIAWAVRLPEVLDRSADARGAAAVTARQCRPRRGNLVTMQVTAGSAVRRRSRARTFTCGSMTCHGVRPVLHDLRIHVLSVLSVSRSLPASGGTGAELAYDLDPVMKVGRRVQVNAATARQPGCRGDRSPCRPPSSNSAAGCQACGSAHSLTDSRCSEEAIVTA